MKPITEKLLDNRFLIGRKTLLAKASPTLRAKLEKADYLLSQDSASLVESWYWPSAETGNSNSQKISGSWQYHDFDNTDALFRQVGLLKMPKQAVNSKQAVYCWFGLDTPVFKIDDSTCNEELYSIFELAKSRENLQFGLVSEDRHYGILINEYVGYLAKHRQTNRNEVVYELAFWGEIMARNTQEKHLIGVVLKIIL